LPSSWELVHIGNVGVDSGRVIIIDPVYKDQDWPSQVIPQRVTGIFPVFQVFEDGWPTWLFVDFESEPPDRDERAKVRWERR